MMKYIILVVLFLSACDVSMSKNYNIAVKGGTTHEDNLEAAQIVATTIWNGRLKSLIKAEIKELRNENLDEMLGLRIQNMSFDNGEKGVFIQCIFKSSLNEKLSNKVTELCKTEVEVEIANYFGSITSN